MIEIGYPYYFFGSPNSVDVDVLVEYPATSGTKADKEIVFALKEKFKIIKDWNLSVFRIENGIVTRSMQRRGSPDAVHNSLYYTYKYHNQAFPSPLVAPVHRHLLLAVQNCVRTLLAINAVTNQKSFYDQEISPILRQGNWQLEVSLLSRLRYDEPFFNNSERTRGLNKSIAFDVGQTISLLKGKEYYIKQEIIDNHPELAPLINREDSNVNEALLPKIRELQHLIAEMKIQQLEKYIISYGNETVNTKFGSVIS